MGTYSDKEFFLAENDEKIQEPDVKIDVRNDNKKQKSFEVVNIDEEKNASEGENSDHKIPVHVDGLKIGVTPRFKSGSPAAAHKSEPDTNQKQETKSNPADKAFSEKPSEVGPSVKDIDEAEPNLNMLKVKTDDIATTKSEN